MRRIFRFMARPIVWSTGGLLLLLLALYVVCDLLDLTQQRWLVELVVGTPLGIFLIVYWTRRFLVDRRLTRELSAQARKQSVQAGPDALRDLKAVDAEFQHAFAQLNDICKQRGLVGGAAALPWVLVLGPPAVGKTTALNRSGLSFTSRRMQGIGPTRNCTWWLASDAVFLDTAGRYSVVTDDHDEWRAFLHLLGRRRRRAIDAVVLQVGLDELLDRSEMDIEQSARRLRERLDELTQILQVQFPVHLLINKCDLIDGFLEFFAQLSSDERAQAWGFSLDVAAVGSREPSLGAAFDERFGSLISALGLRTSMQVLSQKERLARESTLFFTAELEALRSTLRRFVEVLFAPVAHTERPRLVAVYLASAEPNGDRRNGFRHGRLAALGLPPQAGLAPASVLDRPFFLRGVFSQVIRSAEQMAWPSARRQRRLLLLHRISIAAGTVACLGASFYMATRYRADVSWLTRLHDRVVIMEGGAGVSRTAAKVSKESLTRELRNQYAVQQLLKNGPRGALTRPHETASLLLRRRVDTHDLLPLQDLIKQDLTRAASLEHDRPSDVFDRGYGALKALYVLSGQRCPSIDQEDAAQAMVDYFVSQWQLSVDPDHHWLEPHQQDNAERALSVHGWLTNSLAFFFDQDPEQLAASTRLHFDEKLRDEAKRSLKSAPTAADIVFRLRASNANLYRRAPQLRSPIIKDPGIENVFTTQGCTQFFNHETDRSRPWWRCVLEVEDLKGEIDLEEVYRHQYVMSWNRWLSELGVQPPKEGPAEPLGRAGQLLDSLVRDPQRPDLTRILQVVGQGRDEPLIPKTLRVRPQTGCTGWMRRKLTRATKEYRAATIPTECRLAQEQFLPFFQLAPAPGQDPPGDEEGTAALRDLYVKYLETGRALRVTLGKVRTSAASGEASLKLVRTTMEANGELRQVDDARRALIDELHSRLVNSRSDIRGSGLHDILKEVERAAWHDLLPLASTALSEQWARDVYEPWKRMKENHLRYNATDAEQVKEVVDFLRTKLTEFSRQHLNPFYVGKNAKACNLNQIADPFSERIPLSASACQKVQAAIRCGEVTDPNRALGAGGAAGSRRPEGLFVVEPSGCAHVDSASVDNGTQEFSCSESSGRCAAGSTGPLHRSHLWVKWKGHSSYTPIFEAESYDELVHRADHTTKDMTFTVPAKLAPGACPGYKIKFTLAPAPGGAVIARPENCWRSVELPSSLR